MSAMSQSVCGMEDEMWILWQRKIYFHQTFAEFKDIWLSFIGKLDHAW